jgi:hypothetical protein
VIVIICSKWYADHTQRPFLIVQDIQNVPKEGVMTTVKDLIKELKKWPPGTEVRAWVVDGDKFQLAELGTQEFLVTFLADNNQENQSCVIPIQIMGTWEDLR